MPFVSTFDHTNIMNDKIIDRDELQANLINQILDDMDIKTMMAILYDNMDESYDKYSVDELIEEVKEYYPELLED
jgi:arginine/lysine/ornithine decarboxylase